MASATSASDPIQRLFLDKIKEFSSSNKGLDEAHEKAMKEEVARLQRVYNVDENKLATLDRKFSNEIDVSVRDLEDMRETRRKIKSGELFNQVAEKPISELAATVPSQERVDVFHAVPLNKPDPRLLRVGRFAPPALKVGSIDPDIERPLQKMTPKDLEDAMRVSFGPNMPTIHDEQSPERDHVNFPRPKQPMYSPPTRFHFIPESWFSFFYPKTGATGPYVFAGTLTTFLLSKELLVLEHELLSGVTSSIIVGVALIKFGPKISTFINNLTDEQAKSWDNWKNGSIAFLEQLQSHYKNEITKGGLIDEITTLRKQDIENQLELEHRTRLKIVYDDVKRRLNYLVALNDSQRQIAHKNMVDWVIKNAVSSFGPKQDSEVLDNCIAKLKQLGTQNAKAI